jgi:hypothetical protein
VEIGERGNYQDKPRHRATSWSWTLLPGSERLATLVDGAEKDLPPGEQLLILFRPFLENLAASDLSPRTIQEHVDNIWALGGEFIRDIHSDPSMRKRPVDQALLRMLEYGGPLLYHGGAENSGGSSPKRLADARRHPQISPTRRNHHRTVKCVSPPCLTAGGALHYRRLSAFIGGPRHFPYRSGSRFRRLVPS